MDWNPAEHYKDIEVAEQYDSVRFSSLAGKVFDRLEKRAIVAAFRDVPRGTLILDIPSGTGRLAEALLEAGYDVMGMDISPAMLEVARRKLSRFGDRYKTEVMDVQNLPNTEKKFSAALCARVLMHFPLEEQIRFLGAVAAVTDGPVVFNQSLDSSYNRMRRKLKMLLGNQPPANFPISEADLANLLAGAKLTEKRRHSVLPLISEARVVVAE
jgi:2-polyprenyl-3-methyl-5-hydroxy-6-metoxy-1,4-benzoquinol methylase